MDYSYSWELKSMLHMLNAVFYQRTFIREHAEFWLSLRLLTAALAPPPQWFSFLSPRAAHWGNVYLFSHQTKISRLGAPWDVYDSKLRDSTKLPYEDKLLIEWMQCEFVIVIFIFISPASCLPCYWNDLIHFNISAEFNDFTIFSLHVYI